MLLSHKSDDLTPPHPHKISARPVVSQISFEDSQKKKRSVTDSLQNHILSELKVSRTDSLVAWLIEQYVSRARILIIKKGRKTPAFSHFMRQEPKAYLL